MFIFRGVSPLISSVFVWYLLQICLGRRCSGWRWKRKLMRPKDESSWLSLKKDRSGTLGISTYMCNIISFGADCMIYAWLKTTWIQVERIIVLVDAFLKKSCMLRASSLHDLLRARVPTNSSLLTFGWSKPPSKAPKDEFIQRLRNCISFIYIIIYLWMLP